jgi:hypothetical protein
VDDAHKVMTTMMLIGLLFWVLLDELTEEELPKLQ